MMKEPAIDFDVDVDRMIKTLLCEEKEDLKDEIMQLSRRWVTEVMSQPCKGNKNLKIRSFSYSKKKISDVLRWRKKRGLLSPMIPEAVKNLDEKMGSSLNEHGCFYWYGTDSEKSPNLWYRVEIEDWNDVVIKDRMEKTAIILQAVLDAMPPSIHNFNFILLLDDFKLKHALRHPSLGPSFLREFMMCCPDRLKRAIMVTGSVGSFFFNIAKAIAPKSLIDKITVVKHRSEAAEILKEGGIVTFNDTTDEVPIFLGGTSMIHEKEITSSVSQMVATIRTQMMLQDS